jgi:hypothetical protein
MKSFWDRLYLNLTVLGRLVWRLPQTLMGIREQRRQRIAFHEHEVERLDRIRNPSKYRGK